MDDARRVRRGQAVRDLDGEVEQPADVVRRLNRRAIHALHYEVRRPHVVELTDIRMIQGCDGARFALEAFRELGSGCLDGNEAIQASVAGSVNVTHPAAVERRDDLIGT